jgi:hypothetical protein
MKILSVDPGFVNCGWVLFNNYVPWKWGGWLKMSGRSVEDRTMEIVRGLQGVSVINDIYYWVTEEFFINPKLLRVGYDRGKFDALLRLGLGHKPHYSFKPSAKMLLARDGSRKLHLTEKETAILKYLYRVGDRAVPREMLLDQVWGYNAGVTTHTLETHIYRLRQKIEPDPASPRLLVTEAGGYRLVR